MGGGNGAKSAKARERAADKKGPTANSINKVKDKVMNIQCAICKQPFMCTSARKDLDAHVSSKHSKMTFVQCFPTHEG